MVAGQVSPTEAFPSVSELAGIFNEMRIEDKATVTSATKKARMDKIRKMVANSGLHNSADYYAGATIMAEGSTPEDALLTHDLAITALAMGDVRAKQLAVIGEDQFLIRINRPQRFGTQFKVQDGREIQNHCDPTVSESMRQAFGFPLQPKEMLAKGKSPRMRTTPGPKKMMPANRIQTPASLQ